MHNYEFWAKYDEIVLCFNIMHSSLDTSLNTSLERAWRGEEEMPGCMGRSHRGDILIRGQGWGRGHTAGDTGRAWAAYGYIGQVHEWWVGFVWWAQ